MWNLPGGVQVFPFAQFRLSGEAVHPTFIAVIGVAIVITLLLYTARPRISRRTVVALLPWMIVTAALSVLASNADYPAVLEPAVSGLGAYVTVYALLGLVWFATVQFARSGQSVDRLPTYLGSTGAGAATVMVVVLLLRAGTLTRPQIFWLIATPIIAATVAGMVLLLLGLWYPEAAAYTGIVGGLVVFGHTLAAIALTVAVMNGVEPSALSLAIRNVLTATGAAGMLGIDRMILWAGGFIWVRIILATAAIVALAKYTDRQPSRGNLVLGFIAAIGVVGGSATLFSLVVSP